MIVATAAYMIPVADKDIQLTVDHAEEDVLEGFVLLVNVPDLQMINNNFQEMKEAGRRSEEYGLQLVHVAHP